MSDPFAAYGSQATKPARPAPLRGPILRRADARIVYNNIVTELSACEDATTLELYLLTIGEELIQFETQLDFLWIGDGEDFAGLNNEIRAAHQRCSDGDRAQR